MIYEIIVWFDLLHSDLVWFVFIMVYTTLLWFNLITLVCIDLVIFVLVWFGLVCQSVVWFSEV